jgi:hypothetical protein
LPIYALIFNISVNNRQPCITKQTGELNMTDRAQFEAMLEALINDDTDQAKEIFHNIVVSKSREIYEELLAEDFDQDSGNPYGKKEEEDMEEGEEEAPMEGEDEEDEPADDAEGEDEPADDDSEDGEEDPFASDDEEGDGGDMEDRVMDLEDALEDLKAEFEQLLSQEDEEGGHDMDAIHDAGDDAMGGMDAEMDEVDGEMVAEPVMEYYKKVSVTHGDNGQNTRSAVAGKNDMGGTTANIAKSFSTTSGGTQGGLANPKAGDLTSGLGTVHNRVQSNAGKTAFKKSEPGHGAEKKGERPGKMIGARTGEMGGQRGEQSTQSMINGAPKRAK